MFMLNFSPTELNSPTFSSEEFIGVKFTGRRDMFPHSPPLQLFISSAIFFAVATAAWLTTTTTISMRSEVAMPSLARFWLVPSIQLQKCHVPDMQHSWRGIARIIPLLPWWLQCWSAILLRRKKRWRQGDWKRLWKVWVYDACLTSKPTESGSGQHLDWHQVWVIMRKKCLN